MPTIPTTEDFIEIMVANSVATTAAIQCLVVCLQNSGALRHGEYPETLRLYIAAQEGRASESALSILRDLRAALLE